jgi:hypothetical protein
MASILLRDYPLPIITFWMYVPLPLQPDVSDLTSGIMPKLQFGRVHRRAHRALGPHSRRIAAGNDAFGSWVRRCRDGAAFVILSPFRRPPRGRRGIGHVGTNGRLGWEGQVRADVKRFKTSGNQLQFLTCVQWAERMRIRRVQASGVSRLAGFHYHQPTHE